MQSVRVSVVFISTIVLLLSPLITGGQFSKVVNIFQENITVEQGDVLQCQITKTNLEERNNDYHVLTKACIDECYIYHPVSGKCFSFKVKASKLPHLIFRNAAYTVLKDKIEVILEINQKFSAIRQFIETVVYLNETHIGGLVNDREFNGFWIRWLDDELLEVGRESETIPFLSYRFSEKLEINFVGILTWTVSGAWIIDRDPKCPSENGTEIQKKLRAESDCIVLK